MKTVVNWLPAAAVFFLFSCKNEAPKPVSEATKPAETTAAKPTFEKPETVVYLAALDKFRLRETPDPAGKELLQMPKGSIFNPTGKLSDKKFAIKINGMEQDEQPFVEGESGGKTGWAYAPGLLKVHSGKKADAPDAAFSALALEIGKLAAGKLESGKKALDLVKTSATKSGDATFLLLEKTLQDIVFSPSVGSILDKPAIQTKLEKEGETIWKGTFDHSKYPETKAIAEAGLRVETTEGAYFPVIDYKNLQKIFAGRLSPAMQRFVELTTIDRSQNAVEDGGIVIPLNEYAERAVNWINFKAENPNFILADQVGRDEYWFVSDFIIGQNNTPAFDMETQTLSPEHKAAWDIVIKKAPNSDAAKTIQTFAALVAAEGGKRSPKVEAWIQDFMKKMPN